MTSRATVDEVRAWRDQTRVHFGRATRFDEVLSDFGQNNLAWWRDVDLLLRHVDALNGALTDALEALDIIGGPGDALAPRERAMARIVARGARSTVATRELTT